MKILNIPDNDKNKQKYSVVKGKGKFGKVTGDPLQRQFKTQGTREQDREKSKKLSGW